MKLTRVELQNFRSFEHAVFDLTHDRQRAHETPSLHDPQGLAATLLL
ncbi:MAG: hypothetical protein AB7N76_10280 [Planctomycetota bacterium]